MSDTKAYFAGLGDLAVTVAGVNRFVGGFFVGIGGSWISS
jgi:hypothetical protein